MSLSVIVGHVEPDREQECHANVNSEGKKCVQGTESESSRVTVGLRTCALPHSRVSLASVSDSFAMQMSIVRIEHHHREI